MRRLKQILMLVTALVLVAMGTNGCGGVNASGGVSPATFLLPGII